MGNSSPEKPNNTIARQGITKITVSGYKSLNHEQSIEIRPLTILAGANSSGKSSMMQPLLLLKQTLEASYDPGALRLDGPNVTFTSVEQFLSHTDRNKHADTFYVGIGLDDDTGLTTYFHKPANKGLEVQQTIYIDKGERVTLQAGMTHDEITSAAISSRLEEKLRIFSSNEEQAVEWVVNRDRCFLQLVQKLKMKVREGSVNFLGGPYFLFYANLPNIRIEPLIRDVIHLPGLRGNPERTYIVAAVDRTFPGTFENYAASIIARWQTDKDNGNLEKLGQDLKELGLTWKVSATPINDTQVELQVGRLARATKGGGGDMVSIADVGFGVSQTLPVLVALHAARPKQLLYIEQPEIHLHPRAQSAMAQILANAANRGVQVVVETHSSLLILGIQTLVAEGKLSPEKVKLHWFERKNGATKITSNDLDESGAFGDWPEDFADISLEAQSKYLDAAESHLRIN